MRTREAYARVPSMRRGIRRSIATFAALLTVCGAARAQLQGGADWDSSARNYRGGQGGAGSSGAAGPSVPSAARNATVESLTKILSASQLSPIDRSLYLSLRAFAYSRLGREADSQKDVAEMAKVNPQGWPIVLSLMMPGLAGGGDRGAALRALGYGLQKKPNDPWLLIGQAQVQMQIADFPRALNTLDSAVAGASSVGERRNASYFRGHANLAMGNFPQAAEDFESSIAGQTTLKGRIWGALWRYAAQVRGRQDARAALAKDLGNENLYEWPGPIAKFLLGRLPAGELEVAAESDDAAKKTNGKCMAAYFIGMDAVRRGDKQRAREQLQLAQARCPTVSEYNWAASNELKRL
jgi:tetratricopeptide (TPR) repeat protein